MKEKILIVAAHPDDQVLGCGGTISRLVKEGCEAFSLILGEGATSRDEQRSPRKRKSEVTDLKKQTAAADKALGIKRTFLFDFPDNRFDTVPFLDIVKTIEKIKTKLKPDLIFTHYAKDLNVDHRITCEAVVTATRPTADESVREIYSFEVMSSTEWAYPTTFSPDVFYDITATLHQKLEAMREYAAELRDPPHPRSLEGIKAFASAWGFKTGTSYTEAFKAIRILK